MGSCIICGYDERLTTSRRDEVSSVSSVGDAIGAKTSLIALWQEILYHQQPCTSSAFPKSADKFDTLLGNYDDMHPLGYNKTVCAQGAVCLARVQWHSNKYSGLFKRADYCLLRCSSALPSNLSNPSCPMMPVAPGTMSRSVVMPFVALKAFRIGRGTGNLLFGGRKTGQAEVNYFAHCVCTHFTERCSLAMWPVLSMFRKYSQFPTQSGLSDFASATQDGQEEEQPRFPWALILRPVRASGCKEDRNFLQQLSSIPSGTALYHILACSSPDDAVNGRLETIGVIHTVSDFVESAHEARLRFRHQLKEEDYVLRPDWKAKLTAAHKNYGWEHFERFEDIAAGDTLPCTPWSWRGEVCKDGKDTVRKHDQADERHYVGDEVTTKHHESKRWNTGMYKVVAMTLLSLIFVKLCSMVLMPHSESQPSEIL